MLSDDAMYVQRDVQAEVNLSTVRSSIVLPRTGYGKDA